MSDKEDRGPAPSPAIPWVIDISAGVDWYNDTSVEPGTGYTYYVLASNQIGDSEESTITATTLAEPISNDNDFVYIEVETRKAIRVEGTIIGRFIFSFLERVLHEAEPVDSKKTLDCSWISLFIFRDPLSGRNATSNCYQIR